MKELNEMKFDYAGNRDDFVIENEITVEITLHEYRALVRADATAESRVKAANADKYEREQENRKLKEENVELRSELYQLKKQIDFLEANQKNPPADVSPFDEDDENG